MRSDSVAFLSFLKRRKTIEELGMDVEGAWKTALRAWNYPSIPSVIAPVSERDFSELGNIAPMLKGQLAFMNFPEFQTYANLENIAKAAKSNHQRGLEAVLKHEIGHRFCPFDKITLLILNYSVLKELKRHKLPYKAELASGIVVNMFLDMCVNTTLAKKGDEDIPWLYKEISIESMKDMGELFRVYALSMEKSWQMEIFPHSKLMKHKDEEIKAAEDIAEMFEYGFFDKSKWKGLSAEYARIIAPFLTDKRQDGKGAIDNINQNKPGKIDEKTAKELAKRVTEIDNRGTPKTKKNEKLCEKCGKDKKKCKCNGKEKIKPDTDGLKEFKEIMAGFGYDNPVKASITFYEVLSNAYDVLFAKRPFGRPKSNPFQPIKWHPSMGAALLDVDYSVTTGGKIIPGVNTYAWNKKKRDPTGGIEDVLLDLDIYIDSSGSMPNPCDELSLPVLAGFVVAKKAHRKGAKISATSFSSGSVTQKPTSELNKIYDVLVTYLGGGTIFPVDKMTETKGPKQVLIITDTYLCNAGEAAGAIRWLKQANRHNKVTIYAMCEMPDSESLREAGADIITGTSTDIFRKVIGKGDEIYSK